MAVYQIIDKNGHKRIINTSKKRRAKDGMAQRILPGMQKRYLHR